METQVATLQAAGVEAGMINSNVDARERNRIFADLRTGHPVMRLLYVTPETAVGENFKRVLKVVAGQGELMRVVVDEA